MEDDQDSKDSSSSSSSASDETISTLDPAEEESKTFSVVHRNTYALPVQDSQNHPGYQPISWEPYGVNKTDIEESESEFSTRHFGLINSRQHLDKSHYGSNVNDHEVKSKIKQLSKQLSVVRKKIEDFEIKFEDGHGYKPSQVRHHIFGVKIQIFEFSLQICYFGLVDFTVKINKNNSFVFSLDKK